MALWPTAPPRESVQKHVKMLVAPRGGRPTRKLAGARQRTVSSGIPLLCKLFLNLDLDRKLTEVSWWFSPTAGPRSLVRRSTAEHHAESEVVWWWYVQCGTGVHAVGSTSKWSCTLLGVRDTGGATFPSVGWCADRFESLSRRTSGHRALHFRSQQGCRPGRTCVYHYRCCSVATRRKLMGGQWR